MLEFDQTAAVLRMQFAVGSMMLDLAHAVMHALIAMRRSSSLLCSKLTVAFTQDDGFERFHSAFTDRQTR